MPKDRLTDKELQERCSNGGEPADVLANALFSGRWFPPAPPLDDDEDD